MSFKEKYTTAKLISLDDKEKEKITISDEVYLTADLKEQEIESIKHLTYIIGRGK